MTRQEIETEIKKIFQQEFEVDNPEMDVNLREAYALTVLTQLSFYWE